MRNNHKRRAALLAGNERRCNDCVVICFVYFFFSQPSMCWQLSHFLSRARAKRCWQTSSSLVLHMSLAQVSGAWFCFVRFLTNAVPNSWTWVRTWLVYYSQSKYLSGWRVAVRNVWFDSEELWWSKCWNLGFLLVWMSHSMGTEDGFTF